MSEWKNVYQWQPPEGVRVLVFLGAETPPRIEISYFDASTHQWIGLDGSSVTHWSDLPTFPAPPVCEQTSALLKSERRQELYDHLVKKFDSTYAEFALACLAVDIETFVAEDVETGVGDHDLQEIKEAAAAAWDLYDLCRDEEDLDKYAPYCYGLAGVLMRVMKDTASAVPKKRNRGRPATAMNRDRLIQNVAALYKKNDRRGAHFEETVEMILRWVEPSPPTDMSSAIKRALKKN